MSSGIQGISFIGTGCVGIRCCGSLALIMQELLHKYVFCHFFLFLGERKFSQSDLIHCSFPF